MRTVAIVVDDMDINREMLTEMLDDTYTAVEASNGIEAMNRLHEYASETAVLLLDLMMPEMDGFEVLAQMQKEHLIDRFPVLIITGEIDVGTEERCLSCGVTDFIRKPFNQALVKHRIENARALYNARYSLEEKVAEQTAELLQRNAQLARQNEDTIELLGNVVEARSMESGTHVRRVKGFTRLLAEWLRVNRPELGLSKRDVATFAEASVMHDVGKIRVADSILLKPGRLTPDEFEQMKDHTRFGCEVLESSRHMWEEEYYRLCWQICRYHHEKWDGRGYPEGLKGDEIPLVAQIVSVADCYDALTTERVYKKAFPPATAYDMIMTGQCGCFNPLLMTCLKACREDMEALIVRTRE